MPMCLRDTAGSERTMVFPATDPIVVISSCSGIVCPDSGPHRNPRRGTGAGMMQPQTRHCTHSALITRRHRPHLRCLSDLLDPRTRTISTATSNSPPPTLIATIADVSMSVDRLELEVGLTKHEHVVVDQLVRADPALIEVRAVGRAEVVQDEPRLRADDLGVLGAHELVADHDVRR